MAPPAENVPPGWKDTNPKDALGISRAPLSCISGPVLYELGLAMFEGARKYRRHNYRVAGVRHSVYFDAAMRHLWAFWEGEDIDPDSGVHHLTKAIACMFVLRDSMLVGNDVDDRPPAYHSGFVKPMNDLAQAIVEKMPGALPPYTEKENGSAREQTDPGS